MPGPDQAASGMGFDYSRMVFLWGLLFGALHLVLGLTAGRPVVRLYGFGVGAVLVVAFGGAWWWTRRGEGTDEQARIDRGGPGG